MISIYLCDDEEHIRHQLKTALEWKILIENYDMKVVTHRHPRELSRPSKHGITSTLSRLPTSKINFNL